MQAASLAEARALASALASAPAADAGREGRALSVWVSGYVFAESAARFLQRTDLRTFDEWADAAGTPVAALVGRLLARHAALGASATPLLEPGSDALARELSAALDADAEFESSPHRGGEARETGVLARNATHPLVEIGRAHV